MNKSIVDIVKSEYKTPAFHYLFFNLDSTLKDVSFGLSSMENETHVNDSTSYHAFSITKTFTAIAVLQLIEKGKLTLEDTIQSHLPSYNFSKAITIRNLLSHQSGVANPIPLKWTHLINEHNDFDENEFIDSLLLKNLKLKNTPGNKYAYSNLNYLILGKLIEKISGESYKNYISENILKKLDSKDHIVFQYPETNHATGYHPNSLFQNILLGMLLDKKKMTYKASKDWMAFHPFYLNGTAYGGLFATPKLLKNYCQAIMNYNLLNRSSVNDMFTVQITKKEKATGMGLGWFNGQLNNHTYFCHAGGGGGYYSEIRIYPGLKCGSVIMTNSSGILIKE